MLKLGISGCNGAMGRVLSNITSEMEDIQIVFGIDRTPNLYHNEYPVYKSPSKVKEECDVIIDFSNPSGLYELLIFCIYTNTGIVIATTGFSNEQEMRIKEVSKKIPVFKSSNTSFGINLVLDLVKKSASMLGEAFDIEIIEKHHSKKTDAPSGTAYMLAQAINEEMNYSMQYNYGREGKNSKRNQNEIGIHAIRGGSIAGEHTVIFAGMDEIIEIKHTALSKGIFARGAIKAAKYISNKPANLYSMKNLIDKN